MAALLVMESGISSLLDPGKLPFNSAEKYRMFTQLHGTWQSSASRSGGKSPLGGLKAYFLTYQHVARDQNSKHMFMTTFTKVSKKPNTF